MTNPSSNGSSSFSTASIPNVNKPRGRRRYTKTMQNGTEGFVCQICSRSFESARALGGHQNAHRMPKSDAPEAEDKESGSLPRLLWLGPGLPTMEWKENTDLIIQGVVSNPTFTSAPPPTHDCAQNVEACGCDLLLLGPGVLPENWKLGEI